ncbi:DUF123 domain-containing protein [Candidatus Riflebacteria bacterium]
MAELQSYQLFIQLLDEVELEIGKLGKYSFPAGLYIYTGSGKKNLNARIERHKKSHKNLRWHIDYFLISPLTKIIKIKTSLVPECKLNQSTDGNIIIPGFGASDCRQNCGAHLKYLQGNTL